MKIKNLLKIWYVFILFAVAAVFLWVWLVGLITKPKAEEKIGVFVCSVSCDSERLVSNLQTVRPEYILDLEYKWVSPNDDLFAVYYDAFAVYESDLIIMPASKISDVSYVDFYILDVNICEKLFGVCEYYQAPNGSIYGIKIDAEKSLGVQSGEQTVHYLFFNKKSVHLGELGGSTLNGAVEFARLFV